MIELTAKNGNVVVLSQSDRRIREVLATSQVIVCASKRAAAELQGEYAAFGIQMGRDEHMLLWTRAALAG